MSELPPQERLQPSLLDRLRDDQPRSKLESRDRRVLSLNELRDCVVRDLGVLLNTDDGQSIADMESYPHTAHSVLNFGIPTLSGTTASGVDVTDIEAAVRDAIRKFEPRLSPETLQVRAVLSDVDMNQNTLIFDIDGEMWADPLPIQLYLQTEVDLDTGKVQVKQVG